MTFDDAWSLVEPIPGWLTKAQGRVLWDAVLRLPRGANVVEIGSHHGRSTVVLGCAARAVGATVTAIDPFVEGRLFGGPRTRDSFEANITRAGLAGVVDLVVDRSTRLRPDWRRPIDLLYIDGKHDCWTVIDDLRWSRLLSPVGEVFLHDCFSSVGVTCGVLATVLLSRRQVYLGRTGSLAWFRPGRPGPADRIRILRELPWFARNVGIKILLRLRLRRLARLFGHTDVYDPY